MVATKIPIILGQTLTLERVWKVLFRPINLLTKAPAILRHFHLVFPKIWRVMENF
jgi:hypothetical protein